jgi:hypothetical protein
MKAFAINLSRMDVIFPRTLFGRCERRFLQRRTGLIGRSLINI